MAGPSPIGTSSAQHVLRSGDTPNREGPAGKLRSRALPNALPRLRGMEGAVPAEVDHNGCGTLAPGYV